MPKRCGTALKKERPPEVPDEELAKLDQEACTREEERLGKMGVLQNMRPRRQFKRAVEDALAR